MSAEGPAAEFLSFPDSMDIEPLEKILYLIKATIPENYDGETTIEGILYATELGDTGGQIIVNVAMEKKIILTILTPVGEESAETPKTTEEGGGCLIATAAFGSEFAPQVQMLREIRDNTVLSTTSGTTFMTGFNQFYYSFSPTIADWERENPAFKETVKLAITPLLTSLSILNYVDINSEEEMLGYGIGVILLNIGMYFVVPAFAIVKIKKSLITNLIKK